METPFKIRMLIGNFKKKSIHLSSSNKCNIHIFKKVQRKIFDNYFKNFR